MNIAAAAPQASLAAVADVTASASPATLQVTYTAPAATTSYASTVLPDAPAAYYRLGGTSGTTAADASGHGLNATYTGGVIFGQPVAPAGESDTSARLDGTSGYLNAGHPTAFNFGAGDFAVEAWVKPDSVAARQQIAAKDASTGREFLLEMSGAGWDRRADAVAPGRFGRVRRLFHTDGRGAGRAVVARRRPALGGIAQIYVNGVTQTLTPVAGSQAAPS